jgi:hypothetical protein
VGVHPLVAVVIAELRDLGDLLVEHVGAAPARRHGAEAEEAHARGAFTLNWRYRFQRHWPPDAVSPAIAKS